MKPDYDKKKFDIDKYGNLIPKRVCSRVKELDAENKKLRAENKKLKEWRRHWDAGWAERKWEALGGSW